MDEVNKSTTPDKPKRVVASLKQLVLAMTFLCLAACGDTQLKPLPSNAVIMAFGDSLTYGVGAGEQQDYPSVLARLTRHEVLNEGVSGETTSEGVLRFEQTVVETLPDLIILLEGGNDILRNKSARTTKTNLAKMIEISQSREVPIILLGVPEKKLFSDAAPFYQELADEYGVVYDGKLVSRLLRSPDLKSDPIHLNKSGYEEMAESIYQILLDHGAL